MSNFFHLMGFQYLWFGNFRIFWKSQFLSICNYLYIFLISFSSLACVCIFFFIALFLFSLFSVIFFLFHPFSSYFVPILSAHSFFFPYFFPSSFSFHLHSFPWEALRNLCFAVLNFTWIFSQNDSISKILFFFRIPNFQRTRGL